MSVENRVLCSLKNEKALSDDFRAVTSFYRDIESMFRNLNTSNSKRVKNLVFYRPQMKKVIQNGEWPTLLEWLQGVSNRAEAIILLSWGENIYSKSLRESVFEIPNAYVMDIKSNPTVSEIEEVLKSTPQEIQALKTEDMMNSRLETQDFSVPLGLYPEDDVPEDEDSPEPEPEEVPEEVNDGVSDMLDPELAEELVMGGASSLALSSLPTEDSTEDSGVWSLADDDLDRDRAKEEIRNLAPVTEMAAGVGLEDLLKTYEDDPEDPSDPEEEEDSQDGSIEDAQGVETEPDSGDSQLVEDGDSLGSEPLIERVSKKSDDPSLRAHKAKPLPEGEGDDDDDDEDDDEGNSSAWRDLDTTTGPSYEEGQESGALPSITSGSGLNLDLMGSGGGGLLSSAPSGLLDPEEFDFDGEDDDNSSDSNINFDGLFESDDRAEGAEDTSPVSEDELEEVGDESTRGAIQASEEADESTSPALAGEDLEIDEETTSPANEELDGDAPEEGALTEGVEDMGLIRRRKGKASLEDIDSLVEGLDGDDAGDEGEDGTQVPFDLVPGFSSPEKDDSDDDEEDLYRHNRSAQRSRGRRRPDRNVEPDPEPEEEPVVEDSEPEDEGSGGSEGYMEDIEEEDEPQGESLLGTPGGSSGANLLHGNGHSSAPYEATDEVTGRGSYRVHGVDSALGGQGLYLVTSTDIGEAADAVIQNFQGEGDVVINLDSHYALQSSLEQPLRKGLIVKETPVMESGPTGVGEFYSIYPGAPVDTDTVRSVYRIVSKSAHARRIMILVRPENLPQFSTMVKEGALVAYYARSGGIFALHSAVNNLTRHCTDDMIHMFVPKDEGTGSLAVVLGNPVTEDDLKAFSLQYLPMRHDFTQNLYMEQGAYAAA